MLTWVGSETLKMARTRDRLMDAYGMEDPWPYVLQDKNGIPTKKDEQRLGRVLNTWFEEVFVEGRTYQVIMRILVDTLDNLFMTSNCLDQDGRKLGHSARIPLKMTSYGAVRQSGQYVNSDRAISQDAIDCIKLPLLSQHKAELTKVMLDVRRAKEKKKKDRNRQTSG